MNVAVLFSHFTPKSILFQAVTFMGISTKIVLYSCDEFENTQASGAWSASQNAEEGKQQLRACALSRVGCDEGPKLSRLNSQHLQPCQDPYCQDGPGIA